MPKHPNPVRALILLAHGSKSADWRLPFDQLETEALQRWPFGPAKLAFFEHASPSLEEVVETLAEQGVDQFQVEPLLLAAGFHVQQDLPERLEALGLRRPTIQFTAAPVLMEDPEIRGAILERATRSQHQGTAWRSPSGEPIACLEKLKVLEEGLVELEQVFLDLLEDAVVLGCAQSSARALLLQRLRGITSALPDRFIEKKHA
ncbi:CbiX_SirB_N domain containing protein [Burkholderiales bacterium]